MASDLTANIALSSINHVAMATGVKDVKATAADREPIENANDNNKENNKNKNEDEEAFSDDNNGVVCVERDHPDNKNNKGGLCETETIQKLQRTFNFNLKSVGNRSVVNIVEAQTGTLIRQIPMEDLQRIQNNISVKKGIFLDTKI